MIIDSHLHVWSDDPTRYPWAGKGTTEAGTAELLLETLAVSGVDKAVIVQPIHYVYDNTYVADCLKKYPKRFSAMAIMDRHAPDAVEQLENLVTVDGFEGLRMHLARPDVEHRDVEHHRPRLPPAEAEVPDRDCLFGISRRQKSILVLSSSS